MSFINLLISAIQKGVLLGSKNLENIDYDKIMLGRHDLRFEKKRLVLSEALNDSILDKVDGDRLDQLRKVAYYKAFGDCPERDLCRRIADDFKLIGKASICLPKSAFAASLLDSYLAGDIPHGTIGPSTKPLLALIEGMRLQVIEGREEMNYGITRRLEYQDLVKYVRNIFDPDGGGYTSEEINHQVMDFCFNCPDPSAAMDILVEGDEPLTPEEIVNLALAMPRRDVESVPESELPPWHPLRRMRLERKTSRGNG